MLDRLTSWRDARPRGGSASKTVRAGLERDRRYPRCRRSSDGLITLCRTRNSRCAILLGCAFLEACANSGTHPAPDGPPRKIAPPLSAFRAIAYSDSAIFEMPVRLGVAIHPRGETSRDAVTIQWDSSRTSRAGASYQGFIGVRASLDRVGSFYEWVQYARPFVMRDTGGKPAVQIDDGEAAVHLEANGPERLRLVLTASPRLSTLRRIRPESVYVSVFLPHAGDVYNRAVPLRVLP